MPPSNILLSDMQLHPAAASPASGSRMPTGPAHSGGETPPPPPASTLSLNLAIQRYISQHCVPACVSYNDVQWWINAHLPTLPPQEAPRRPAWNIRSLSRERVEECRWLNGRDWHSSPFSHIWPVIVYSLHYDHPCLDVFMSDECCGPMFHHCGHVSSSSIASRPFLAVPIATH